MMLRGLLAALAVIVADRLLSPRRRWVEQVRPILRHVLWTAAILLVLGGVGGALFAISGLYPIAARSEHWAITTWVLELVKHRAVATHSLGVDVPPLEDVALVLKGAGHYEGGCRPCHGAPGTPLPVIPHQMTPFPPRLDEIVAEYDSAGLFYIVKNGLKLTGMPGWPAEQRDDEVWAVVALLERLPGMEPTTYQRLVHGEARDVPALASLISPPDVAVPELVVEVCARCHGVDGTGRGRGVFPKLAGQRAAYLDASLRAYAAAERNSGIMQPIAAALSDEMMREVADYYSGLTGLSASSPIVSSRPTYVRGRSIAAEGIAADNVPSCADCHGPAVAPKNPMYPRLAGQYADYLALQLRLLKEGRRGGTPYVRLMHEVAPRLTERQIRDVAQYYASLDPERNSARRAGS